MAKLKTHKATAKRIKITKSGKIIKRKAGQDHFNARESGKVTRNKRKKIELEKTHIHRIKEALPYSI